MTNTPLEKIFPQQNKIKITATLPYIKKLI